MTPHVLPRVHVLTVCLAAADADGIMKVLVDAETDRILGVHMLCAVGKACVPRESGLCG